MNKRWLSMAAAVAVSGCGADSMQGGTGSSDDVKAAQQVTLPAAAVQQAVELRLELGFRAEPDFIRAISAQPRDYGILYAPGSHTADLYVTPAEQAQLKQRALLQELAVDLIPSVTGLAGDRYAGATLDTRAGGDPALRIRITGEVDQGFEERVFSQVPTDLRGAVEVAYVTHSLAELQALQDRLSQQLEDNGDAALRIVASEIDERANVVVLFSEGDGQGLQGYLAHTGLENDARVEVFGGAQFKLLGYDKTSLLPQGVLEGGLQLDRLRSGIDVGHCATGFAVRGLAADFMLTAGHCFAQGVQFLQGGKEVGDPGAHTLGPDFDVLALDTSRFRTTNGGVHRNSEDWAAAITGVVATDGDLPGSVVCQAGPAANGVNGALVPGGRCGLLESRFYDPGKHYAAKFRRASYLAQPGDSGAPVWMDRGSGGLAEGLVTGCMAPMAVGTGGVTICEAGGVAPNCRCAPGHQIFTHLPNVLDAWEMTLAPY